jgi:hypothetical protein
MRGSRVPRRPARLAPCAAQQEGRPRSQLARALLPAALEPRGARAGLHTSGHLADRLPRQDGLPAAARAHARTCLQKARAGLRIGAGVRAGQRRSARMAPGHPPGRSSAAAVPPRVGGAPDHCVVPRHEVLPLHCRRGTASCRGTGQEGDCGTATMVLPPTCTSTRPRPPPACRLSGKRRRWRKERRPRARCRGAAPCAPAAPARSTARPSERRRPGRARAALPQARGWVGSGQGGAAPSLFLPGAWLPGTTKGGGLARLLLYEFLERTFRPRCQLGHAGRAFYRPRCHSRHSDACGAPLQSQAAGYAVHSRLRGQKCSGSAGGRGGGG